MTIHRHYRKHTNINNENSTFKVVDYAYCGIESTSENEEIVFMTSNRDVATCDECEKAYGMYLLGTLP